jgi:hypothetical protein
VGKNILTVNFKVTALVNVIVFKKEIEIIHKAVSVLYAIGLPKRDEVTGEWRKLHNEELNDLYSLPNIVRVVKSSRMR